MEKEKGQTECEKPLASASQVRKRKKNKVFLKVDNHNDDVDDEQMFADAFNIFFIFFPSHVRRFLGHQ